MSIIVPVPIEYHNYQNERLPHIGVFYVFPRFVDKGLCREFKLSIPDLVNGGNEVVSNLMDYEFVTLDSFLKNADRNHFQAIRTAPVDGVSFQTLANLVAQIHFRDFLKRNDWLKTP